jgi:hypothetical protein
MSYIYICTYLPLALCLQITFLAPSDDTLINVELERGFRVPIVLGNVRDKAKRGNLITSNGTCPVTYRAASFPFTCELHFETPVTDVDIEDVFTVYQDFDAHTGEYCCCVPGAYRQGRATDF